MSANPNGFAYVVLFGWPIVMLVLYQRWPLAKATLWSILGAYLLLPSGTQVDLPMLPPMDKYALPNLAAYLACRFVKGKSVKILPSGGWLKTLLVLYMVSPFVTSLLNADLMVTGPRVIKGLDYYDALSAVIRQFLFILPFLLGMAFIRDARSHEAILRMLVVAGLWYSLPCLLEIRLSPQLHRWVYGYFPHSFVQQMRDGGFRPVVFLGHGLWVAFFIMSSAFSASVFWKLKKSVSGFNPGVIALYLSVVLVLCKSMAALVYALCMMLFNQLFTPKTQIRLAQCLVVLVVIYPMLRAADWFPVQTLEEVAAEFSDNRAQSLKFRLDNEELLLNHARQRGFFGWGSWGRNRVYDLTTGRDLTVTDGRWIIVMGEYGWFGYLAEFGLLMLPVLYGASVLKYMKEKREKTVYAAITLLMAFSIFDLLPNASVTPWTWLLAGALLGRGEAIRKQVSQERRQRVLLQHSMTKQVAC